VLLHPPPVFLRGVTGPEECGELGKGLSADSLRGMADAGKWSPEVSFDVMGQGFERGYVEDPATFVRLRQRLGEESIEGPEECGECLSRTSRGMNQRVLA
jgi:hypothetical protein